MVRKCRGIAEVAVMEVARVGVRTRAQAALDGEAARPRSAKRRNVGRGELKMARTPYVQLRRRKRLVNCEDNSLERNAGVSECSSPSSDELPASCCSSNLSNGPVDEKINFVELENVSAGIEASTYNCICGRGRRETTPTSQLPAEDMSNDEVSTARPTEETARRRLILENTAIESEIEEFFTAAEEDLRKRFAKKYNYDIVKDEPFEGRYEWTRLKP